MSGFSGYMSRVGIRAATVDTQLAKRNFYPGEEVEGEVVIKGGAVEQRVEKIDLRLMVSIQREASTRHYTWQTYPLEGVVIAPREEQRVPFTIRLPYDLPISGANHHISIKTGLDIEKAIDPSDSDRILVELHPKAKAVIEVFEKLNFRLHQRDSEAASKYRSQRPFVMEYELKPVFGSHYAETFDEVELAFEEIDGDLGVAMLIDQRRSGLAEKLDLDETLVKFPVTDAALAKPRLLKETIQDQLERLI